MLAKTANNYISGTTIDSVEIPTAILGTFFELGMIENPKNRRYL